MNDVSDSKDELIFLFQLDRTLRVVKLSALVACWALLTISLLLHNEKDDVSLHTAVSVGEVQGWFARKFLDEKKILECRETLDWDEV